MKVTIKNGSYRGTDVHNQVMELVTPPKEGKRGWTVTVRPNEEIKFPGVDKLRVNITGPDDVVYPEGVTLADTTSTPVIVEQKQEVKVETDEEVMARIGDRFEILEEMAAAAINSDIRGMIVVGPPGVGKSFGVIKKLEEANLFQQIANRAPKYDIVKGAMTPIGLYIKLYNYSESGNVLLFDDCDSILDDELSLNLLKAALDSGKKRKLCWNADSSALRKEGIPDNFDFKGSVIFITNVDFESVRSKKKEAHLAALQSRCHYLDLTMRTQRDCILRIKQIHATGDLFKHYKFKGDEGDQIVDFMIENKDRLREISLRMAVKIADLVKMQLDGTTKCWKRLAETTVMKNSF